MKTIILFINMMDIFFLIRIYSPNIEEIKLNKFFFFFSSFELLNYFPFPYQTFNAELKESHSLYSCIYCGSYTDRMEENYF